MSNPITEYFNRKKMMASWPAKPELMVNMTELTSMECYHYADETTRRALSGCNLKVTRAQAWGITGDEPFEIQLIMEIMGNVKPYETGRCSLCEKGMMRKKRRMIEHAYYVNEQRLIYPHMNVLTWLMHATEHCPGTPAQRQLEWLELLLDLDLDYTTLAYARRITEAEQLIIATLPTLKMSALQLVLVDLSQVEVPEKLYGSWKKLFERLNAQDKAVVMGSTQRDLLQACCGNAAFLINGRLDYQGSIEELCEKYDLRRFVISSTEPEAVVGCIQDRFSELRIERVDNTTELHQRSDKPVPYVWEIAKCMEDRHVNIITIDDSQPTLEQAFISCNRIEHRQRENPDALDAPAENGTEEVSAQHGPAVDAAPSKNEARDTSMWANPADNVDATPRENEVHGISALEASSGIDTAALPEIAPETDVTGTSR